MYSLKEEYLCEEYRNEEIREGTLRTYRALIVNKSQ